jgi:hypothetical protein
MGRVDWDRAPTARDVDDHRAEVEAEKVRQAEVRQELLAEAEVRQELDVSGLCAVSYLLPLAAKSFDEGLDSQ